MYQMNLYIDELSTLVLFFSFIAARQVVVNLIKNGWKHTDPINTHITVQIPPQYIDKKWNGIEQVWQDAYLGHSSCEIERRVHDV